MPKHNPDFNQAINDLDFMLNQLESYLQRFHIDRQQNRALFNYNLTVRELVDAIRQSMDALNKYK